MILPGLTGAMMLAGAVAAAGMTLGTYVEGVNTTTDLTTYTYTPTDLVPGAPLLIFIAGLSNPTTNSRTVSTVTVDGNAATVINQVSSSRNLAAYYYVAPASSTETISVTFSGAMSGAYISHVQIIAGTNDTAPTGGNASTAATASSVTSSPGITIGAGGLGFAVYRERQSSNDPTWSSSGATPSELVDASTAYETGRVSVAYTNDASVTSFTVTTGGSTAKHIIAFAWAP
jgi:hypothetical protein